MKPKQTMMCFHQQKKTMMSLDNKSQKHTKNIRNI